MVSETAGIAATAVQTGYIVNYGVYYIRAERLKGFRIYEEDSEFALGKANVIRSGPLLADSGPAPER